MTLETRRFGRLGHLTSVLVYGAAALADVPDDVADRSIELAIAAGVNSFDTAADYGDAERQLGRWMYRIRDRIFLATKTGDRTAAGAYASICRSLERLKVSNVDLLQLHAVGDLDDLDLATGPGGAIEGAIKARSEGLVGGIGITGHGNRAPATHLEALRRFPFDSVLTPYNYRLAQDESYQRDFDALLEEVTAQDVGGCAAPSAVHPVGARDSVQVPGRCRGASLGGDRVRVAVRAGCGSSDPGLAAGQRPVGSRWRRSLPLVLR